MILINIKKYIVKMISILIICSLILSTNINQNVKAIGPISKPKIPTTTTKPKTTAPAKASNKSSNTTKSSTNSKKAAPPAKKPVAKSKPVATPKKVTPPAVTKSTVSKQTKSVDSNLAAAQRAVLNAENLTDINKYDLASNDTDFANASDAVTLALEAVVKLNQNSTEYKGLMARINNANANLAKAQDNRDEIDKVAQTQAATQAAAAAAAQAAADKAAADKAAADAQAAADKAAADKAAADAQAAADQATNTVINQTMDFGNGDKYIGQTKNGALDGSGTYYWSNGDRYEGEWHTGVREGVGTYTWANGQKYIGQWKNNMRDGYGTLYDSNGSIIYAGNYLNDNQVTTNQQGTTPIMVTGTSCGMNILVITYNVPYDLESGLNPDNYKVSNSAYQIQNISTQGDNSVLIEFNYEFGPGELNSIDIKNVQDKAKTNTINNTSVPFMYSK